MEIRILSRFYISFVFIVSFTYCKTFSLNDAIAAEERSLRAPSRQENILSIADSTISQGKKTSALKYKKTFQITSPSKPKKLKHLQRPRYKRTQSTSKREIQNNDKNIKYIPILRNIGMLFDNILSSGSSETSSNKKYSHKGNQFVENKCTCTDQNISQFQSDSQETAVIAPSATEIKSETFTPALITTTPSDNLTTDNVSGFRRHKIIPLLLARNSSSLRRNNNGFRPRSNSAYNWSTERHFTRVHGINKYLASSRERESNNKYNEEDTDSNTRDDTNSYDGFGTDRGIRRDSQNATFERRTDERKEFIYAANATIKDDSRDASEHEREIKFEIRRNETKSPIFVPKFSTRLREYNTQEENTSLRTSKLHEKNNTYNSTSNKRIINRNGSDTTKNQKTSGTNETITHILPNSKYPTGKVVMIYDGYSVARDVNGENKWAEKAIHIHS